MADVDYLQYFSWWTFAIAAAGYTAMLLFLNNSRWSPQDIFSKQNAKSLLGMTTIHLAFLAILLAYLWTMPHFYFQMPNWSYERGRDGSGLDILSIIAMTAMAMTEIRLLYAKKREFSAPSEEI